MNAYTYDLHAHSCLSPCADNDNTPNNLAGMAALNNCQIMALTDHNTTKNCPAFFEACRRYGVIPVPGMELTTAEEVHVVCLFPTLDEAMAFNDEVEARRILIPNRKDIFGDQLILNAEDELIGEEPNLLSNATEISLEEVPSLVEKYRGVCYPAHIDRDANGVIAMLGTFPETPFFSAFELHDGTKEDEFRETYPILQGKRMLTSSDAHYLESLREDNDSILLPDEPYSGAYVRERLIETIRGGV